MSSDESKPVEGKEGGVKIEERGERDEMKEDEVREDKKECLSPPQEATSSWSSTFTSILSSAKQKSAEAYELMKKDLNELKEALAQDTASALSSTSTIIQNTTSYIGQLVTEDDPPPNVSEEGKEGELREKEKEERTSPTMPADSDISLSVIGSKAKSLLNSMFEVLTGPSYDDDENGEICIVHGDTVVSIPMERWRPLLASIQLDPQTYNHEPDGPPDDYENWLQTFNLLDYQKTTERFLRKNSDMRNLYDALVPSSITSDEFWHRYFYRVHQLRKMELQRVLAKRATGQKKGDSPSQSSKSVDVKKFHEKPSSGGSSDLSEDWEKAELGDIVDEAAKKIGEKINKGPEPETEKMPSDDWTFE